MGMVGKNANCEPDDSNMLLKLSNISSKSKRKPPMKPSCALPPESTQPCSQSSATSACPSNSACAQPAAHSSSTCVGPSNNACPQPSSQSSSCPSSSHCQSRELFEENYVRMSGVQPQPVQTAKPKKQLDWAAIMRCVDLASMTMPSFDVIEENVSVYLAGYLAFRLIKKFENNVKTKCKDCYQLWVATPEEKEDLAQSFTFFRYKMYHKDWEVNNKGLTAPSKVLLTATTDMERMFRQLFPIFVAEDDVFTNLFTAFTKVDSCNDTVCSDKCDDKQNYMMALYGRVRLNYDLKCKNRKSKSLKKSKAKKLQKFKQLA